MNFPRSLGLQASRLGPLMLGDDDALEGKKTSGCYALLLHSRRRALLATLRRRYYHSACSLLVALALWLAAVE